MGLHTPLEPQRDSHTALATELASLRRRLDAAERLFSRLGYGACEGCGCWGRPGQQPTGIFLFRPFDGWYCEGCICGRLAAMANPDSPDHHLFSDPLYLYDLAQLAQRNDRVLAAAKHACKDSKTRNAFMQALQMTAV